MITVDYKIVFTTSSCYGGRYDVIVNGIISIDGKDFDDINKQAIKFIDQYNKFMKTTTNRYYLEMLKE